MNFLPWGSEIKRDVIAAAAVLNTLDVVWWGWLVVVGGLFDVVVELLLDFGCERSKRWLEFKWFNTSATLKMQTKKKI